MTGYTQGQNATSIRNLFDDRQDDKSYLQKFVDRFWSKVSKGTADECWEWEAHTNSEGYGGITLYDTEGSQHNLKAHRVSKFIHRNGISIESYQVNHTCGNKSCVNPDHLVAGTASDNISDQIELGERKMKLDDEDIKTITLMRKNTTMTQKEIAEHFPVSEAQIGAIIRNDFHESRGDN